MTNGNLDIFMTRYVRHLTDCVREMPDLYAYPVDDVPAVIGRMRAAIKRARTFKAINKDSPAIRRTLRELGIKDTFKAMDAYITEGKIG